jgi:trimeric autotransporter adhesin
VGCSGFFISPTLTSLAVGPQASIQTGGTVQMQAVGTYNDGTQTPVTSGVYWSSSATNIATISTQGVVTGVSVGQTTISAAASAVNGSTTVTVTLAGLTNIQIKPFNTSITVGSQLQYVATGTANGKQVSLNGAGDLNWTLDNSDGGLINIDNTGLLTADSTIASQQIVHVTAQDPTTGIKSNTATLTINTQ